MISFEQARAAAESQIRDLVEGPIPVAIVDSATLDKSWCWVFFYQSRRFLETGSPKEALAGNGPVVVEKETGTVHVLGSGRPVERQLQWLHAKLFGPGHE